MSSLEVDTIKFFERTRSAFLWVRILNIPFWVVYNILYIILFKELGGSPLQVAVILALKPMAALLSPYWGLLVYQRQDRLLSNLIWANIIKFIPFLFFPWITNNWLLILAFGYYMIFVRGVVPAWMEIIKQNIQGIQRERVFAFGSAIDYLGSALLPLAFGWVLDFYPGSWRWIFFGSALLGIFSTCFLYRIPIAITNAIHPATTNSISLLNQLVSPWRSSWNLLQQRPQFKKFQLGYLLGGSALAMVHTVQSVYFIDVLQLSYKEILFALALCKGIGFAMASPWWVKRFDSINIFCICSLVTVLCTAFPLLLLLAVFNPIWIYIAFFIYGIMQAGSELSWHMSGPIFAGQEDSSLYSTTNVLIVGLRGAVVPLLASWLLYQTNSPLVILLLSAALSLIATERMYKFGRSSEVVKLFAG